MLFARSMLKGMVDGAAADESVLCMDCHSDHCSALSAHATQVSILTIPTSIAEIRQMVPSLAWAYATYLLTTVYPCTCYLLGT